MTQGKWTPSIPAGGTPKYLAVVAAIERAIESGELQPNQRLPTNRELRELFDVTIATVTKAMAVAARKGLIVAQVGSGTFVRDTTASTPKIESLDLSLNILPSGVVDHALQGLAQAQAGANLARHMFGYGSYAAAPAHARRAIDWMATFGAPAEPDNVLLTVGVHQGLMAAFHALLAPGDSAICEELTYTGIKRIASYRNVSLHGARCDEHGMVPESLEKLLKSGAAKVVIVTSALHNPTTATLPLERREAIARLCTKYDAYLVEDGINLPLVGESVPTVSSFAPERSLFLTGFSKCVASGFRLGYAVTPPSIQGAFYEALVSTQWIGPSLYADLAETMLGDGLVERCTQSHRDEARARYTLASQILKGVRPTRTPGYHAWVDAPAGQQSENFVMQALRQGVKVSPATHFAVSGGAAISPTSYRISLGACADRAELERALHILAGIDTQHQSTVSTLI